ncbi:disease resistance protein At4g27190 [Vigna angularis]|uniref:disease resistance protein At4g27190 n=1 Tax=Phaseolus angularis TaxID=3914 RepID=UPI00080A501B|nr:disease resistance protein At4g27190 [Vigna angularis]
MNFDSRKDASDQLMEALKDDGVTMIGLYGMGGCGKTTLAMEVKKIAQAEHLFDTVIFVLVSSTVEVSRIQDKIASSLQYPFPESQEMERAQRLCMRLTEKKKILMILDDVWEPLDFGRIGIPLSEYHKGRKILITTRSEEVCISMDCQKKIYLPILSDDEALSLFQEKALKSKDTPENIKRLAISISKECKGLPIAIVAVASSLKGKQEVLWHAALNKLRSSKPINISMGLPNPYMCLKLSYDNLDTEEARSLFLLCSVFPEDYEIPVECLIRCAIGLGVARVVETYEATRIELTEPKIKLVSSCLLLEADDKHVKMHDLVRDVAHGIAKNENKIIKCEVEKDVSLEQGSIRYLWCVKFPDDVDCSNLEFLTIQTKSELSDGIFERMGKLRVLIITNKNDDRLQLSTTSFKSLTNLHCLILQQWNLRDISFVRDMKKLQSLSFHGCSLPSFLDLQTDVALTTLTDLKLLEFKSCDIESNIFEEIKRIPFLEELYIFKDYRNDQKEESVKFSNSLSVPKKLQRYGIILEYDFHTYYRFLEFFTCERTLGINYFDISNEVVKGLAKKVKELFVGNIKGGAKNMMPDIFEIEDGMNELKDLTIYDCEEIECLIDTSNHLSKMENIFSKLRYMQIRDMNHLKTLWHGCLPANGSFEKLEKLSIFDCEQLTCLFTIDKTKENEDQFTIGHSMQFKIFQNLQEVIIIGCKELKHVFTANNITGGLTQLKKLVIGDCNMLEQIIEEVLPPAHCEETNEIVSNSSGSFSLSNLEFLEIYSCSMLDSLFTTSVAKTLTSLEELEICICDGLKHVVTPERVKKNKKENMVEDKHEFKSDLSMFSSLKRVTIWHCNSMQDIFAMPFVGGVVNIQNHFPTHQTLSMSNANNGDWMMGQQVSLKLEYLNLFGLPKMTRIWVNTNNSFTLQHLNSLIIKECEKLEVIFPQFMLQSLPDLSHIRLRKCEELRQIIEEDLEDKRFIQPCFPKLQSLFIEECHKLKCFASVSASNDLSNLKILIIKEATELQEFIACEYDETGKTKVQLPQLKVIIFMHLSNFHQETIFSNVKHRIIRNCPKLSLTSTTTPQELQQNLHLEGLGNSKIYRRVISQLMYEIEKLDEVSTNNNSTEVPSSQIKEESDKKFIEKDYGSKEVAPATSINLEVDGKSNCETYSQELVGAKSTTGSYLTDQQNPLGQTQSTVKMTSDPQAMEQNFPVISSPNMTQRTHQTEANNIGKTTTSDKLAIPTSALELVHKESNNETGFPYQHALGETMNIEEIGRQRTKDGPLSEEAAIKTRKPNEVTRASTDIRTRLEECKHFADLNDSRISLLVEAISAYPHLWKACEKFSDRFQALMLKTLTDMLLFLRSESVGSVNPDKEKEFLKLCDEAVQLGFEKSWVDEMRQRVVGRDSKLDHAKTRIGDLLKRHAHLTQELNNMKIELVSLHDYFDVPTKCFDFL